jgi:hypothetical protein
LRLGSGDDAYGDDIPFIPWVDSGVTGQFFRKEDEQMSGYGT